MTEDLIFKVAKRRLQEIQEELPHPDIATHFSVDDFGRGLIDIFYQGALIGQEIIETADSWRERDRLLTYRDVLRKKIRLVVMAPRSEAMKVRYLMLELNNWWLFYYMVYGYDSTGRLVRVLRPYPQDRKAPGMPYISQAASDGKPHGLITVQHRDLADVHNPIFLYTKSVIGAMLLNQR